MEAIKIVLTVLHICGTVHWTPAHKKAECLVFRSAAEMTRVWVADGGKEERAPVSYDEIGEIRVFTEKEQQFPSINFEKEMVVAVFGGQKPAGGYSVHIEKAVHAAGKKTVWVIYSEKAPGTDAAATEAPAFPSHVVAVPKVEGEVKFAKSDSEEARKVEEELTAAKPK